MGKTDGLKRIITLNAIECQCSIGWHDHEREKKQRVLIDIAVRLAAEPVGDAVSTTLDYDALRDTAITIAASRHFDLQETLAREIFDAVAAMDGVIGVAVETTKPDAYADVASVSFRLSDMD